MLTSSKQAVRTHSVIIKWVLMDAGLINIYMYNCIYQRNSKKLQDNYLNFINIKLAYGNTLYRQTTILFYNPKPHKRWSYSLVNHPHWFELSMLNCAAWQIYVVCNYVRMYEDWWLLITIPLLLELLSSATLPCYVTASNLSKVTCTIK